MIINVNYRDRLPSIYLGVPVWCVIIFNTQIQVLPKMLYIHIQGDKSKTLATHVVVKLQQFCVPVRHIILITFGILCNLNLAQSWSFQLVPFAY